MPSVSLPGIWGPAGPRHQRKAQRLRPPHYEAPHRPGRQQGSPPEGPPRLRTHLSDVLNIFRNVAPPASLSDPLGQLRPALRAVVQGENGPQHPRVEPAPRLHPGGAQGGGEGGGGRPRRPEGRPAGEVLQPHSDDGPGAAAAHRRE